MPLAGLRGGLDPLPFQSREDERVDRIARPTFAHNRRQRRTPDRLKGPVFRRCPRNRFVVWELRSRCDPTRQAVDLLGAQRRAFGGHAFGVIVRAHPLQEFAVVGPPRDHDVPIIARLGKQAAGIETQVPFLGNRPVARDAAIPQQRLDVAGIVDCCGEVGPQIGRFGQHGWHRRNLR